MVLSLLVGVKTVKTIGPINLELSQTIKSLVISFCATIDVNLFGIYNIGCKI